MKTTIKLLLIVSIFTSVAFADGDMGNGSKNCTSGCFVGTQTNDNKTIVSGTETESKSETSILMYVKEYLDSVYQYFGN